MTATWSIRINAVDAAARIKNLPASAETRITASRGVQANAETAVRASSDEGVIEFSSMMLGCASRALRPSYIASFLLWLLIFRMLRKRWCDSACRGDRLEMAQLFEADQAARRS